MKIKCPNCGHVISDKAITRRSGQIGGRKTAKRGSEYFKRIAGMRKNRRGGRPKTTSSDLTNFAKDFLKKLEEIK